MRFRSAIFFIVVLFIAAWSLLAAVPAALQPSLTTVTAALPAYLQPASSQTAVILPLVSVPVPVVGLGSSVIPPGPFNGQQCSTNINAGLCSAQPAGSRCSALNGNNNRCSTFSTGSGFCSTTGINTVCSVLPPLIPGGVPSQCSTFALMTPHQCSALSTARKQRCSTKGQGQSECSTFTGPAGPLFAECSVFNVGATQRSFCSTKLNQPQTAKSCSTLSMGTQCSIVLGGKGICTSFGAALANSCSALSGNDFCSVIGGAPGNRCVQ